MKRLLLLFLSLAAACAAPVGEEETGSNEDALKTPANGGAGASCVAGGAGQSTCGPTGKENCCVALDIGNGTRLDKYQVTAGRMKAFLGATNGDVRGWYTKNKAKLRADAVAQIDPYVAYLPSDLWTYPYGAYEQVGGTIYLPQRPSTSQGCFVGDAKNPGYGSHTYPLPAGFEPETRGLSDAQLAAKSLNCIAYPLAAAFCAWDGGRLQTKAEHDTAWGPATYPWGAAPVPAGYMMLAGMWTRIDSRTWTPCPACDVTHANYMYSYQFPATQRNAASWDYAINIAEPGRFPLGNGPKGHADLAGNMMELTATFDGSSTTVDQDGKTVTQPNVRWTKNGSWEGHGIGYDAWSFPIMTKYAKTGLRCAR